MGLIALIPTIALAASSIFPIVADIAQICKFFILPLSQLKDNSHWFPLLLPINSCHSSIIIDDNSLNRLLDSLLESKRDKDSGVVIRILGGLASCFFFSYGVVSPFLISTVISLLKCKAANCMEFFRSLLSAFKGVINNIFTLLLFLGSSIFDRGPINAA